MNYDEFRAWRDDPVRRDPSLRLDCMNPAKALNHFVDTDGPAALPVSPTGLLNHWQAVLGLKVDSERFVLGVGVRDLLRALFESLASNERTFWLPRDVYPIYWKLAKEQRLDSYTTIPDLDLSFLARTGPYDCVLLPSPLSPKGRRLSASESNTLAEWLNDSANRQVILDRVYDYSIPICKDRHRELVAHERCCSIFSTSKAWLLPQAAGVAIVSAPLRADVQKHATPPNQFQQAIALERLLSEADLPTRLQRRFDQQWLKLQPQIQRIEAEWKPPETGYFSIVATPSSQLWDEHRVVGVPASVFGSAENVSIITCLFDIKADDLG